MAYYSAGGETSDRRRGKYVLLPTDDIQMADIQLNQPTPEPETQLRRRLNYSHVLDIEDDPEKDLFDRRMINKKSSNINKAKQHIIRNKGKYMLGAAGLSAGITGGLAGFLHTGGEALANEVKRPKSEPDNTTTRLGLLERLHKDEHISTEDIQKHRLAHEVIKHNMPDLHKKVNWPDLIPKHNSEDITKNLIDDFIESNDGHMGWLRNYPHFGPGNKIFTQARNSIDNIARNHDIAYSRAKNEQDIFKADAIFLEQLHKEIPSTWTDSFIKQIGVAGIGAKTNIEKHITGVIYPKGLSKGK